MIFRTNFPERGHSGKLKTGLFVFALGVSILDQTKRTDYPGKEIARLAAGFVKQQGSDVSFFIQTGWGFKQKRSDLLLKAWEKLADQLPDWRMIVVGDGPYYQEMSKIIAEKQIPRISLEGYQKPEPYYQRAGIFLMTSAYEGFPNVILEAQSYGCVPVAYDSYPALSWIVNDQEDARLVPAYDGEEMTSRVVALASNVEQLKVMQQNALNNARQFTIEEVGQQWLRFFERNGININL